MALEDLPEIDPEYEKVVEEEEDSKLRYYF